MTVRGDDGVTIHFQLPKGYVRWLDKGIGSLVGALLTVLGVAITNGAPAATAERDPKRVDTIEKQVVVMQAEMRNIGQTLERIEKRLDSR